MGGCSPKLTLHMKQGQDAFDVIITDSSDPVGSAKTLFKESYYQLVKVALKDDGKCHLPGRVSAAAPGPHQGDAAVLQVALPCGDFRLLHHPHLPQWPDGLHAVQQKSEHQLPEAHAAADVEAGGIAAAEIIQL